MQARVSLCIIEPRLIDLILQNPFACLWQMEWSLRGVKVDMPKLLGSVLLYILVVLGRSC